MKSTLVYEMTGRKESRRTNGKSVRTGRRSKSTRRKYNGDSEEQILLARSELIGQRIHSRDSFVFVSRKVFLTA